MLRRVIELVMVIAVTAGLMVAGGAAAQAQSAGNCDNFPGTSSDARRELTLCSHVDTFFIVGKKYVDGFGELRIGSLWSTSATGCKISTWLTLSTATSQWDAPTGIKPYSICTSALSNRNVWFHAPLYQTSTTATKAFTTVCVELFYNNSPAPGWKRCVQSSAVVW